MTAEFSTPGGGNATAPAGSITLKRLMIAATLLLLLAFVCVHEGCGTGGAKEISAEKLVALVFGIGAMITSAAFLLRLMDKNVNLGELKSWSDILIAGGALAFFGAGYGVYTVLKPTVALAKTCMTS